MPQAVTTDRLKPHGPECPACGPTAPGHPACQAGCGRHATVQHRRHATADEYAAIPQGLRPIDGVAHVAVFTCEDCEPSAICDHDIPPVPPCAGCGAIGEDPCTKPDGTARATSHRARATPPPAVVCDHAHREDCDIVGCRCGDDQPPTREPRPPEPPRDIEAEHRWQQIVADAERAFVADLIERYGGDRQAASQAAAAEFAGHIQAATEAYDTGRQDQPQLPAGGA